METYNPFGLKPAYDESGSGAVRSDQFTVASAYGSNIFNGSPVRIHSDGTITLVPAGSTVGTNDILGVFEGCQFQNTDGSYHNGYWPAGRTYLAGTCKAFVSFANGSQVFEVQANAAMASTTVGKGYATTTNDTSAGSTATGQSTVGLNVAAPVTAPNPAQLLVVGLALRQNNAWNDGGNVNGNYPIVLVKVGIPQFAANIDTPF